MSDVIPGIDRTVPPVSRDARIVGRGTDDASGRPGLQPFADAGGASEGWPDINVDEGALRFQILAPRRLLAAGGDQVRIMSASGRGYMLQARKQGSVAFVRRIAALTCSNDS